jgi:ribosomal-protein-alanine N-acetyltransferase
MIRIKNLEKNDIPKIVELETELLLETLGSEMLQAELHNQYAHFFCAKDENEPIGYIGCWIIEGTCDMINFVVQKDYQRMGVGSSLFNKVLEQCRKENATEILLEVRASNIPAISFYKKFGFQQIATRKQYYKNKEDACILRKDLYENLSN